MIHLKPPTKDNITQVARQVREHWNTPNDYYPTVCHRVRNGKVILSRHYDLPDADSNVKPLCTINHKHPRNRMSDYRADIWQKLHSIGITNQPRKPPTKKNLYQAAKAVRRMSWDNDCPAEIRVKFDMEANQYRLEATLGPEWNESEARFGFLLYSFEDCYEDWTNRELADFIDRCHLQRVGAWFDRVRYDPRHREFVVDFKGAVYAWNPDVLQSNDYNCGAPGCIDNPSCKDHIARILMSPETKPLEVVA